NKELALELPGPVIGDLPWAPDLTSIDDLLDDTAVTRAAATAALHLMKKGKMGKNKNSHNPVLVNAILRTTGQ
ncbi:hypothetical protein, partial [Gordonia jacobaea]|uniref:hypothetical protein n=1 Tax=Gordonia jacobaea TaxID=122202 RepID=UPI0022E81D2E